MGLCYHKTNKLKRKKMIIVKDSQLWVCWRNWKLVMLLHKRYLCCGSLEVGGLNLALCFLIGIVIL